MMLLSVIATLVLSSEFVTAENMFDDTEVLNFDYDSDVFEARTFNLSLGGLFNNSLFGVGIALLVGIVLFEIALYALDVYYNNTYGFGGGQGYGYNRRNDLPFGTGGVKPYRDPFIDTYRSNTKSSFSFDKVLSWLSLMEETYSMGSEMLRDFDCQKKAICEVYQDQLILGDLSVRARHGLDVLDYANYIRVPDFVMDVIDEFQDAKESARTESTCQYLYPSCTRSLKGVKSKYDLI